MTKSEKEPLRQFKQLLDRFTAAKQQTRVGGEFVSVEEAHRELLEWAEAWIRAYAELEDRLRGVENFVGKVERYGEHLQESPERQAAWGDIEQISVSDLARAVGKRLCSMARGARQ